MRAATLSILACMIALVACESKEARVERNARTALREVLIDPTSFLVRKLRSAKDESGDEAVCGEVNGKNRMGGYVGFQPFVATRLKDGEVPQVAIDNSETSPSGTNFDYIKMYQRFCEPPIEKAARLAREKQQEEMQREWDQIRRNKVFN